MNPLGAPGLPLDLIARAGPRTGPSPSPGAQARTLIEANAEAEAGPAAEARTRARIEKTAKDFEATFISQMLGAMFSEVEVSAPFGGGPGEAAFRSFLFEATAKQMASAGGLGLADDLKREMLRMQGLD